MKSNISTNIGIFFLKAISLLPFWCIYCLSDFLYVIVYYVIKYRKKVVVKNLKNAFPLKSSDEIKEISKKFYHHLADITLETIKMRSMSQKDFDKRMIIVNPDLVNNYFKKGKSVVVLTMHYNNWEWSNCFSFHMKHRILFVYKPLHNSDFDKFINKLREKPGNELVSNLSVLRRLLKAQKTNELVFTWLAADQTPPEYHKLWMMFLNQETMFYPGPAYISRSFNHPVFLQKIEKTGRGRYKTTFELLFDNPAVVSEIEIMKKFIEKIELQINEKPEYYLWSHKRWKHKRPENIKLQ